MTRHVVLVLLAATTVASADPAPAPPAPTSVATPIPAPIRAPIPALVPPALTDPLPKPREPRSLRDEARRVAADLAAGGPASRDPDLLLMPWAVGRWSANGRANKLDAGAGAATLVGEAVLGFDGSPLAALAAFVAGATLDAAAADVEAASPPPTRKKKRVKHTLR